MDIAQSLYLRIFTKEGTTLHRWQNYYVNNEIDWNSNKFIYVPFGSDGFTSGSSGDEADIRIFCAALPFVVSAFETALTNGHLATLSIYQFDASIDNTKPQANQFLLGRYIGQVAAGSATMSTVSIMLGSALSPVGAQIPPRKLTYALMGRGCIL